MSDKDFESDFNLDNDDWGLDNFEFEDFETPEVKDDRHPALKPVYAVGEGLKNHFLEQNVFDTVKQVLPKSWGEGFSLMDNVSDNLSQAYEQTTKDLKPLKNELKRLGRNLHRYMDGVLPDAIVKKIADLSKQDEYEYSYKGQSKEELVEAGIQKDIADIFQQQEQITQEREQLKETKEIQRDAINVKQHKESFSQLDAIRLAVEGSYGFAKNIDFAYKRKSLEIQLRHYQNSVEIKEIISKGFTEFKAELEGIKKNTGLPEYRKTELSESFREQGRNKFVDWTQRKALHAFADLGLDRSLKSIREDLSNTLGFTADQMAFLLDFKNSDLETAEAFGEKDTVFKDIGGYIGNKIRENTIGKASTFLNNITGGRLNRVANEFAIKKLNFGAYLEKEQERVNDWFNDENDTLKGKLKKGVVNILNNAYDAGTSPDTRLHTDNLSNLNKPDIITRHFTKSVVEIIPGYLSRILREVSVLRTGQDNGLIHYDFTKNDFSTERDYLINMQNTITNNHRASESMRSHVKYMFDYDFGKTLSPQTVDALKNVILADVVSKKRIINGRYFTDYKNFEEAIGTKEAKRIANYFAEYLKDDKDRSKEVSLIRSVNNMATNYTNPMDVIQSLATTSGLSLLRKSGWVKGNELHKENYFSYFAGSSNIRKHEVHGDGDDISMFGPEVGPFGPTHLGPDYRPVNGKMDYLNRFNIQRNPLNPKQQQTPKPQTRTQYKQAKRKIKRQFNQLNRQIQSMRSPSKKQLAYRLVTKYRRSLMNLYQNRITPEDFIEESKEIQSELQQRTNISLPVPDRTTLTQMDYQDWINEYNDELYKTLRNFLLQSKNANQADEYLDELKSQSSKMGLDNLFNEHYERAYFNQYYDNYKPKSKATNTDTTTDITEDTLETTESHIRRRFKLRLPTLRETRDELRKQFTQMRNKYRNTNSTPNAAQDPVADVYVDDETSPRILARLMKAGRYFDQITGKVIKSLKDIKGPVVDQHQNIVLDGDELQRATVTPSANRTIEIDASREDFIQDIPEKSRIKLSKYLTINPLRWAYYLPKDILKANRASLHLAGQAFKIGAVNSFRFTRWVMTDKIDVFVKGEPKPSLYAKGFKDGFYFDAKTGKPLKGAKSIKGPVMDQLGNILISEEDIEKGLVNRLGKPINKWAATYYSAKILKFSGKTAYHATKQGFKLARFTYPLAFKGGFAATKSLFSMGGKSLSWMVKDLQSAIKENNDPNYVAANTSIISAMGNIKVASNLEKIYEAVTERYKKVYGDHDGDGDVDGSVADKMQQAREKKQQEEERKKAKQQQAEETPLEKLFKKYMKRQDAQMETLIDETNENGDIAMMGSIGGMISGAWGWLTGRGKARAAGRGGLLRGRFGKLAMLGGAALLANGAYNNFKQGNYGYATAGAAGSAMLIPGVASGLLRGIMPGVKNIAGKALGPLAAIGLGGYDAYTDWKKGDRKGAVEAVAGTGGALVGAAKGAAIGATLGSVFPGIGTVVGGAVGGIVGGVAGWWGGSKIGSWVTGAWNWLTNGYWDEYGRIRAALYGFEDKDLGLKVLEFERIVEENTYYTNGVPKIQPEKLPAKEIMEIFDLEKGDEAHAEKWSHWYANRFYPVYVRLYGILNRLSKGTKLENISNLDDRKRKAWLESVQKTPRSHYKFLGSPFKKQDEVELDGSEAEYLMMKLSKEVMPKVEDPKEKKDPKVTQLDNKNKQSNLDKAQEKSKDTSENKKASWWDTLKQGLSNTANILVGMMTFTLPAYAGSEMLKTLASDNEKQMDELETIRFKAYGLSFMDVDKVSALRNLERATLKYLDYAGIVKFNGNLDSYLDTAKGILGTPDKKMKSMHTWIVRRFLPVFLVYVHHAYHATNIKDPNQAKLKLTGIKKLAIADEIRQAKTPEGDSIWKVSNSPWDNYLLNQKSDSVAANYLSLKNQAKTTTLAEKKLADTKVKQEQSKGNIWAGIETLKDKAKDTIQSMWQGAKDAVNSGMSTAEGMMSGIGEGISGAIEGAQSFITGNMSGKRSEYRDVMLGELQKAGITDPREVAAFLAQVSVETNDLLFLEELASGAKYNGRRDLGNTQPGDGPRFKGRGLLQLTGRANYEAFSKAIGRPDIMQNPELVKTDPSLAVQSAIWYWKSRKGLREAAQKGDIVKVSKLVNGGTNHLDRRVASYKAHMSGKGSLQANSQLNGNVKGMSASNVKNSGGVSSAGKGTLGIPNFGNQNGMGNTQPDGKSSFTPGLPSGTDPKGIIHPMAMKAADICRQRLKPPGNKGGACALYVRKALQAAGYKFVHTLSAKDYGPILERIGFIKVSNKSPTMKGDIQVWSNEGVQTKLGAIHGHIQIYDGRNWLSDIIHPNGIPAPGYNNSKTWYYTYRHYASNKYTPASNSESRGTAATFNKKGSMPLIFKNHQDAGNTLPDKLSKVGNLNLGGSGGVKGIPGVSSGAVSARAAKAADYAVRNARRKSSGYCARYVRLALQNGGGYKFNGVGSAKDYGPVLERIGFTKMPSTTSFMKGDVVVWSNRGVTSKGGSRHGHIQIFSGSKWVSDFIQNQFTPGGGYRNPNTRWTLYRDLNGNKVTYAASAHQQNQENNSMNARMRNLAQGGNTVPDYNGRPGNQTGPMMYKPGAGYSGQPYSPQGIAVQQRANQELSGMNTKMTSQLTLQQENNELLRTLVKLLGGNVSLPTTKVKDSNNTATVNKQTNQQTTTQSDNKNKTSNSSKIKSNRPGKPMQMSKPPLSTKNKVN